MNKKINKTIRTALFIAITSPLAMNVYGQLPKNLFQGTIIKNNKEQFVNLLNDRNVVIQRIVSSGQVTPKNHPYYQQQDEWVLVLQGVAKLNVYHHGIVTLRKGDYYFIPRHTKHWVIYTSKQPKVIWLTVHIFNKRVGRHYMPD